jgi:predicted CopG family antitoxin
MRSFFWKEVCELAHKTLTISEEAYELLLNEKQEGESFTNVIIRLLQKPKLSSLSLRWHGSDDEAKHIFEEIFKERKEKMMRDVQF